MNLPQSGDPVKLLSSELIESLLKKAAASPRQRTNFNFHPDLNDNPHRFLNVMIQGTYFTPHRHLRPPKAESFVVLQGRIAFFIFEENGDIREHHILGEGEKIGIDIAAGLWHTIVVLSPHAVCFEVKPGPYDPKEDKEFAPWAPSEGGAGTEEYTRSLLSRISLS